MYCVKQNQGKSTQLEDLQNCSLSVWYVYICINRSVQSFETLNINTFLVHVLKFILFRS